MSRAVYTPAIGGKHPLRVNAAKQSADRVVNTEAMRLFLGAIRAAPCHEYNPCVELTAESFLRIVGATVVVARVAGGGLADARGMTARAVDLAVDFVERHADDLVLERPR